MIKSCGEEQARPCDSAAPASPLQTGKRVARSVHSEWRAHPGDWRVAGAWHTGPWNEALPLTSHQGRWKEGEKRVPAKRPRERRTGTILARDSGNYRRVSSGPSPGAEAP